MIFEKNSSFRVFKAKDKILLREEEAHLRREEDWRPVTYDASNIEDDTAEIEDFKRYYSLKSINSTRSKLLIRTFREKKRVDP